MRNNSHKNKGMKIGSGLMNRAMILSLVMAVLCGMMVSACHFGSDSADEEDEVDSLEVDSLGLEELDLFEDVVIPKAADELFDDFMYSYMSSSSFREERTDSSVEPLELDEDGSFIVIYERENDLELQKDTSLNHVVVENIVWEEDLVRKYEFNRNGTGQWFLTGTQELEISDTPNALFLTFLKDFSTDTLYQHESITWPLLIRYFSEEYEDVVEESMTREEWIGLYADLPDFSEQVFNIDYGQSLISSNRKSVLMKGLSNGLLMTFHFVFSDGRWMLELVES